MVKRLKGFKFNHLILVSLILIGGLFESFAQCPTVSSPVQTFCDLEAPSVSDLVATDNGGGIQWYDTAVSVTPLGSGDGLTTGEDYYADDNSGSCGTRQRVDVTIYGAPAGFNFQGVCVDDPNDATISDLSAIGNNVEWYSSISGGSPLPGPTILNDNTIYYANQENPITGCRTSRLSVLVNIGIVPVPTGDAIQEFCTTATPTVDDLTAIAADNWYASTSSVIPLDLTEPLMNGQSYYATSVDPPCESNDRFEVLVIINEPDDPGTSGSLDICETEVGTIMTVNLFDELSGSPDSSGTWSGPLPTSNGDLGTVDVTTMTTTGSPYIFTYEVGVGSVCPPSSSTVTITITPEPIAGSDGSLDICGNDSPQDLFTILGGTPDSGGTWSPALASGTGVFDPAVDATGIYTYTVTAPPCDDASASVSVAVIPEPIAGTNGSLDICNNDTTTQDLFTILGGTPDAGGTWSPALASGTGVFDPTVDAPGTYTYTVIGNPPCGDASASVTIAIIPEPNAGTNGSLDICENDTTSQDLFTILSGTPDAGGTWSPALASGTGVFDPTVDAPGTYTYTVTATPCGDVSASVIVAVIPEPIAGTNGSLDICENDTTTQDLFTILGGTPDADGTWSPALASGTGIFDPTVDAPGTYTYTVTATPCGDATASVTVAIIPEPIAGTNGSLDICENDTTSQDLFTILGGTPDSGGIWSPALASGTGVFDPTVDAPGTYTYTVTATPCGDASASVSVAIIPEPIAGSDGNIDICNNDSPQDLFTILGGTPDTGGTWSPALASGTGVFDPTVDAPGTYTYTVTAAPCGDASASVTIALIPEPIAGTNGSLDICENDTTSQDLFTILGGTPDTGGTWSPALASGTGVFDPTVDAPGTYTYTVTATPCGDASASVTVAIIPEPIAGSDGNIDICNNDSPQDLFTILGGTPDAGGTWSPALASGTGVFDPTVDPPGTYTYTVTATPCGDASASVTVAIIPEPNAGTNGSLDICENDTTSQDLFTILGGAPDAGGTWSPALASGTGVFDPTVDAPGTYTYTIIGDPLCGDASASVTVAITPEPNAGSDGSLDICGNDSPQDLFTILGGTPDAGGTWSPALASGSGIFDPTVDAPDTYTYTITATPCGDVSASVTVAVIPEPTAGTNGNIDICNNDTTTQDLFTILGGTPDSGGTWSPALASGTGVFDPTVDAPGTYTYTVTGNPPCGDASASVTIAIIPEPNAGTNGSLDICENDTTPQDLFTILGGTPDAGGTWSPALASGTGVFDPAVDAPGTYTYTVTATPCGDVSASVIVAVIPEPIAGTNGSLDICENDTTTQDLFTILGGTPDTGGTWSPALASGTGIFDPTVDAPGTYTYTVTATPCGDASASVTVAIIPEPNAGTNGSLDICENDTTSQDLFTILGGTPDSGGTWSPALASGTGVFDPAVDAPGTYTYTIIGDPLCGDATASVTVAIIPEPNAGSDGSLDICGNDSSQDLFTILGGTPDSGGTWSPALASGTGIFDPTVDAPGTYTYTVTATPCGDTSASVTVAIIQEPIAGSDGNIDICNNDSPQDLFTILGGTPDAGGTWSPALASGTGVFDPTVDSPGAYTYTVTGNSPCGDASADVTVTIIPEPNAGTPGSIDICDNDNSQDLFTALGGTPDVGGTWSPVLASGSGIFDPATDMPGTYTYTVGPTICNQVASSTVRVVILSSPDATGAIVSIASVCLGSSNIVNIDGATLLPDGDYTINYNLTGSNNSQNTVTVTFSGGSTSFNIPENLLTNIGTTTITINEIIPLNTVCSADVSIITSIDFDVLDSPTPSIITDGNTFCESDEATINDLTVNITGGGTILWYDAPTDGTIYSNSTILINDETYYASSITTNGCESIIRLEVTVILENCEEDIIIPDGFSPNGDTVNDEFIIKNLPELYPNFTLEVYNRYGNILYKGNINTPNWDGNSSKGLTVGGSELPSGVYFFILNFNDGNRDPIQGRVYLNR